jgi:tetratricopeptide (TPR) repeat protein
MFTVKTAGTSGTIVPVEKPNVKVEKDGTVVVVDAKSTGNAVNKEKLEKEKLEKEKLEKERLEKEKLEKERLEKEKLERERQEKAKKEEEILKKEKLEKEKLEKEKLEKEKLEKERLEKARLEKERLEKEKLERERQEVAKKEQVERELREKQMKQEKVEQNKLVEVKPTIANEVTVKSKVTTVTTNNNPNRRPLIVPTAAKVVKSTNYDTGPNSTMNIVNRIERNLTYGDKEKSIKNDSKVEIKKGEWKKEELVEVDVKSKFEIVKTGKKTEMQSKEIDKNVKISSLKDLAFEAIKLRQYEIAIKLYKEILKIDEKDNFSKLSLATTYHMLGQYVQAKPYYIELLSVFPNSEQLISNLLSIIVQESPFEAIYLLPGLANKYNDSPTIQAQTSIAFSTLKKYDEAIPYIQKAIDLDTTNIEYMYNLAVLYDMTKQYDKAYRLYKEIFEAGQNDNLSIPFERVKDRVQKLKKYM